MGRAKRGVVDRLGETSTTGAPADAAPSADDQARRPEARGASAPARGETASWYTRLLKPVATSSITAAIVAGLIASAVVWFKGVPELKAKIDRLSVDADNASKSISAFEGRIEEQRNQLKKAGEDVDVAR